VEDLINDFERILTMPLPQPAMASSSQANNQMSDLIARIVNSELNPLRNEIVSLKAQLNQSNQSGNLKEKKTGGNQQK